MNAVPGQPVQNREDHHNNLILTAGLKAIDEDLNMSVLAGIISGIEAGYLYNRFHAVKLPEFLGFFGGRRFVPIVTALVSIVLAGIFGVIWGPCQAFIHAVGEWIIGAGVVGTGRGWYTS